MSVGVFLEQIRIWIGELSKTDVSPVSMDIIPSVEGPNRTKKAEEGKIHSV